MMIRAVDVDPGEYKRLLGYPASAPLSDRAVELMAWANEWYTEHGRPWMIWRESKSLQMHGESSVAIDGVVFSSRKLHETLQRADACLAIVAAVGAGVELEQEAQKRWLDEKPDEYFFLEIYGSAVVEHLVTQAGAQLCEWADAKGMAVLPHQSPGYPEWDISEQARLLELLGPLPAPLEVLESGMLRPKKSLLAVFGVTHHVERVAPLSGLVPCADCSFGPCQFRRVPYRRGGPQYNVNQKALKRWAAERLLLERKADGAVDAVFRYEGTTCTNMGRPLEFDYFVKLGPAEEGYPIRKHYCSPAPSDTGHKSMCGYLKEGPQLLTQIAAEQTALSGKPLSDVLSWSRPASGAGCYCEPSSRLHKWGLVLETIHYALSENTTKR